MSIYKHIQELEGETIVLLERNNDEAVFTCESGRRFQMYHSQDCCESVTLDAIEGNIDDILNHPITKAQEHPGHGNPDEHESCTFTDFVLTTEAGSITIHWTSSSNGYYIETVDFIELYLAQ